jgi:hypothetical protein
MGLQQMGYSEAGTQRRAVAPVKVEERLGHLVVEARGELSHDPRSNPGSSEPLTLQAEVSNIIERIDRTETRTEL